MADEANQDDAEEAVDDDLTRWIGWLDKYMADLPALPGEKAIDFCEAAGDLWQRALTERPPKPDSAAALVLLEVAKNFAQVMMAAVLDERVTRDAAQASLLGALEGVRNDARSWLENEAPTAEAIAARVEAVK
ncbi:hypothetical protein H7H52_00015, partial [Mycolicibacter hiberniae]|nr:hypothetical protein [Mycolicibacter hiberniae]